MTATATVSSTHRPTERSGASPTAGTGTLVRFMLRRDRVRLTSWVAGIGLLTLYFSLAVQTIAADEAQLAQLAGMFSDPVGRLMTGPAFGMDEPTYERFFSAGYALFLYIFIALMSAFTVVRHTRAEEQSGRAELMRANVVGRHATLTAALLLTAIANVAIGVLMLAATLAADFALGGSALVATAGVAVGLFFAAVAAVTSQMSESSRGASAMAGGLLALAYLIRMGGDMSEAGGSALSWFSPLGWAQQTAPYVEDRWWPLLPLLVLAAALTGAGFWLSTTRDVGAGLLAPRLGRSEARPALGTPLGLAARVLRGNLRGWGVGLVLAALMFGSYAQALVDAADDLPAEFHQLFPGDSMVLGYLAYMGLFLAIFVAAAGVSAMGQLRGEELRGRAELALSAPVGRTRWLGSHLGVLLGGLLALLLAVGIGTAVGAVLVLADGSQYVDELVLASVHQAPAVVAVVGIVAALFGWLPRAANPAGWLVIGYAAFMSNFGQLLELPEFVHEFNVFGHLARYPVEDVAWTPVWVLTALGAAGLVLGLAGWSRREVNRV